MLTHKTDQTQTKIVNTQEDVISIVPPAVR